MTLPSLQECAAAFERLSPEMAIAASGSVLVLGLAGLVVLAMRRASGSARHEVWMLGFTGVLLLPILSAMLPGWHVLPAPGRKHSRAAPRQRDRGSCRRPDIRAAFGAIPFNIQSGHKHEHHK